MTTQTIDIDDLALEQTDDGRYRCPVDGCEGDWATERSVSLHYGVMKDGRHDSLLVLEIVTEEEWESFLLEEIRQYNDSADIAAKLPDHIGRHLIQESLSRYELPSPMPTQEPARTLAKTDVTTFEEARKRLQKQRRIHADDD